MQSTGANLDVLHSYGEREHAPQEGSFPQLEALLPIPFDVRYAHLGRNRSPVYPKPLDLLIESR